MRPCMPDRPAEGSLWAVYVVYKRVSDEWESSATSILLIPEETGTEQMDAQKERLCILFACLT